MTGGVRGTPRGCPGERGRHPAVAGGAALPDPAGHARGGRDRAPRAGAGPDERLGPEPSAEHLGDGEPPRDRPARLGERHPLEQQPALRLGAGALTGRSGRPATRSRRCRDPGPLGYAWSTTRLRGTTLTSGPRGERAPSTWIEEAFRGEGPGRQSGRDRGAGAASLPGAR